MSSNPAKVHPNALCEDLSSVGEGTRIWAFSNVQKGSSIGADCNICDNCFVESGAVVGNRVTVKNGVSIWNGVTVEDDVFLGPNCAFTNDMRPRSKAYRPLIPTIVKQGASIGANATILPGITIGRYAMIGAGSVVTRDVEDFTCVVGNPARLLYRVTEDGEPVKES